MSQEYGQATIDGPGSSLQPESLDSLFDALADRRRREAVALLAVTEGAVSREELVEYVAAADPGIDDSRREVLTAQFHHRHLPKLAAAGLVDYDEVDGTVHATETAERVTQWFADL